MSAFSLEWKCNHFNNYTKAALTNSKTIMWYYICERLCFPNIICWSLSLEQVNGPQIYLKPNSFYYYILQICSSTKILLYFLHYIGCTSLLMLAKVTNNVVLFVQISKCTNKLKFYELDGYWVWYCMKDLRIIVKFIIIGYTFISYFAKMIQIL